MLNPLKTHRRDQFVLRITMNPRTDCSTLTFRQIEWIKGLLAVCQACPST